MEAALDKYSLPHGTFFIDPAADGRIARHLARGEYHEAEDIELIRHFLTPASTVVDIGAHIGLFLVPLARQAKRAYGFEPSATTFRTLEKNVIANALRNVTLRNSALGDRVGQATMHVGDDANAGANYVLPEDAAVTGMVSDVRLSTLDAENIGEVSFIKIDVEGMEERVLRGAQETIATYHPAIFFEINMTQLWLQHSSPRRLQHFFKKMNYDLYVPDPRNAGTVGKVWSLWLITFLITPGSWLFKRPAWPFNILALPRGFNMPAEITVKPSWVVVREFVVGKINRLLHR